MPEFRSLFETPIGTIELAVNDECSLTEILLPNRGPFAPSPQPSSPAAARTMRVVKRQLEEYFTGRRTIFDLPLQFSGSPFERRVWTTLLEIPFGVTTSYGAIATELGLINGARAVGRANGANPIPIVIPCHRVIGSDGRLTGYGGGLPLKRALLELEGALASPELPLL
ncbi:MAG: methylated-DNA--[protein]-cysteine S-methyltransferase [Candidatus Tumulicola sp.]